jgi:hypothetical protein
VFCLQEFYTDAAAAAPAPAATAPAAAPAFAFGSVQAAAAVAAQPAAPKQPDLFADFLAAAPAAAPAASTAWASFDSGRHRCSLHPFRALVIISPHEPSTRLALRIH